MINKKQRNKNHMEAFVFIGRAQVSRYVGSRFKPKQWLYSVATFTFLHPGQIPKTMKKDPRKQSLREMKA